jgi:hypothetical protein
VQRRAKNWAQHVGSKVNHLVKFVAGGECLATFDHTGDSTQLTGEQLSITRSAGVLVSGLPTGQPLSVPSPAVNVSEKLSELIRFCDEELATTMPERAQFQRQVAARHRAFRRHIQLHINARLD